MNLKFFEGQSGYTVDKIDMALTLDLGPGESFHRNDYHKRRLSLCRKIFVRC